MKGLTESAIHAKYIDMVRATRALRSWLPLRSDRAQYQDMKRIERDHSKEKQKLTKDKDASKSQLTKANAAKTRLENVGRELQKVRHALLSRPYPLLTLSYRRTSGYGCAAATISRDVLTAPVG